MNIKIKNMIKSLMSIGDQKVSIEIKQADYHKPLLGKTVVIAGGSKGIGLEIARKCAKGGAEVVISSTSENNLKKACEELGGNVKYVVHDISKVDESVQFLKRCKSVLGTNKIDYLVCNAGISLHEEDFTKVSVEGFDKQFEINLRGTYFLSKAFLEMKLEEKDSSGELLVISSETADQCYDIPYGMTKASINSMICAFSRRVYKQGIRVNGIAPGVTATEMTKSYADVDNGNYSRGNAAGRVFLPEEIAEVALFLLSDMSKCISGEIIHCNGGNHLRAHWDITY